MSETAILMAAGLGTRLRPLTETTPKPLIKVHGKPMIESVIDGLLLRGVCNFFVVVGYLGKQFSYLEQKYDNLKIIFNEEYNTVNNISSIHAVLSELEKTDNDIFICETDLFLSDIHLFETNLYHSCYFGKMVKGYSNDWVFETNKAGRIIRVGKGGRNTFNMVGVAWLRNSDARILAKAIRMAYEKTGYEQLFWDDVVNNNLDNLDLIVHEIADNKIVEIDTFEELKQIDRSYMEE